MDATQVRAQVGDDARGDVLVVDDTTESRAYLCALLESQGYAVRAAPSGELALWSARKSPPDIVLLDVRMPDMDGFEVCRRLKEDARTAAMPVIFLSAQDDTGDKLRGFHSGAVDFIGKPFASEEVLSRVATHVKLARITRELEARVKRRTEDLRLAASAFEVSLSAMFVLDDKGDFLAVNPAFATLTGYAPQECLGRNIRLVVDAAKHDEAFLQHVGATVLAEERWTGEIWGRRKDGNEYPCLGTLVGVRNDDDVIVNRVGVFHDLSESRDAQMLIDFLSHHDGLTGLPNRVLARDRFRQLTSDLQSGEIVAVICVNLDRFRAINDFHGYAVGNQVLQWVAGQLGECLPLPDTVFREAADEFVLIHRARDGIASVQAVIANIQERLNTDMACDDLRIPLSVSLGATLYPNDGDSLETLTANAALAMSHAKEEGGRSYVFFSARLDQEARLRFDIAQRLRHALEREEFEVYYQPQIETTSGRLVAAEALLRWRTDDLGFISPMQFIPIAEETGAIIDIGTWVLRAVCTQIAAWKAEGLGAPRVAVNLSARQFMRYDICATVRQALADSGVAPSCLELEITESALVDDVPRATAIMRELKSMGVSLALDDFGTGYSSLSYLKKFPIDYLKIDQSFVRHLGDEPDADAIVLSIIGLARNMRMGVIAEGVETEAQRDFLATLGCGLLQGYLFGKPVPVAEFRSCLAHSGCGDRQA